MIRKLKQLTQTLAAAYATFKFRRKNRSVVLDVLMFLFLAFFAVFSVWPLLLIANNAFKPMSEIFLYPPRLFVINPTLNNFRDLAVLLSNSWVPMSRYVFNTLFITAAGTVGSVIIGSMAAFPLAKYRFPGSRVMSQTITYALMFNGTVLSIPVYIIMTYLGLVDSYWAILFPTFAGTLGLFLMRNFMTQIPDSLLEAAKIDGAGELRIFLQMALPLSGSIIAVMALYAGVGIWNSWFGGLLYITSPSKYPLALILRTIIIEMANFDIQVTSSALESAEEAQRSLEISRMQESMRYALIFVSSAPVLIAYPFVQKHFVKGVLIGSVKG